MSCAREEPVDTSCLEKGEVVISLSTDAGSTDVKPQMKSVDENAPESPDDFEVEIYNSKGIRLYRDTYANSVGKKIALNTGEYRLLAQYGDSSAVSFNPSAAWYAADEQFTVNPQSTTEVSAVAKMSKVKVAVNHGPNIQADYSQYYSLVKLDGNSSKELRFEKGETRAGYIPAGKLVYELYVYNAATSKWLYCPIDAVEYKPNTFVTFNVDINKGQGTLKVSISIDDSVDEMTQEVEVPFEAAPQEKPTVALAGFAEGNIFSFVEGVEYENVQANIVAKGKIKSCIFSHTSGYLKDMKIPSEVDLADPDLDAAVVSALKSAGFKWPRKMRGERFGNVDFAAVPDGKIYSADNGFNGTFKVSVTDSADYTASVDFTIKQVPASLSINVSEGNFWAKRIKGISASTSDGILDYVDIQYSADSQSWTTVKHTSAADGTVLFPDIEGLSPATNYYLRAIYNNNEDNVSEPVSFTTETEQQVGNAGFEDFYSDDFMVRDALLGSDLYQKIYYPWAEGEDGSSIWETNNTESLVELSVSNDNLNYRSLSVVSYVKGYSGDKAAQIISACVGNYNTSFSTAAGTRKNVAGRLSLKDGGCQFLSRPDRLSFYFKYVPRLDDNNDSDTFRVLLQIKNDETVIGMAQSEMTYSEETGWTKADVEVNYSDLTKKATKIYVEIRQSTSDDPVYNINVSVPTYDGSINAHAGSVLTIDDLQLIYE